MEFHAQLVSSAPQHIVCYLGFIAAIEELLAFGESGLAIQQLVLEPDTSNLLRSFTVALISILVAIAGILGKQADFLLSRL